jgi:lactate permease
MIDFLFAALPILFLIAVMTKPKPLPSTVAFILTSALAYVVRFGYFRNTFGLLNASVINGLLDALTPISILFCAIFFFVALEKSGAMGVLQEWLRQISNNSVAQLMIVGWAFVFLSRSLRIWNSAALAAPILVGLGFPAIRVALLCLIFNSIPTVFGAVGTPMWFGFELLALPRQELIDIGLKAALLQSLASLVIPVVALRFVVDWKTIQRNLGFIYLSLLCSVLPMLGVAWFSYEFPAVVGGVAGLVVTIVLARFGIGLEPQKSVSRARSPLLSARVLLALTPLIVTVVILLVTRIPGLGLREFLTSSVRIFSFR